MVTKDFVTGFLVGVFTVLGAMAVGAGLAHLILGYYYIDNPIGA